jgi:hypothetical protein
VTGGETSRSYDSGWELQPDGSYKRRQETHTSYSSGSGAVQGSVGQGVSFHHNHDIGSEL